MDKENRTKRKRKLENGRKNKKNKEERQNKEIEERRNLKTTINFGRELLLNKFNNQIGSFEKARF